MAPLKKLPPPNSAKVLKRCMGFFSYYCKWVRDYATKERPVFDTKSFPLSPMALKAFERLKLILPKLHSRPLTRTSHSKRKLMSQIVPWQEPLIKRADPWDSSPARYTDLSLNILPLKKKAQASWIGLPLLRGQHSGRSQGDRWRRGKERLLEEKSGSVMNWPACLSEPGTELLKSHARARKTDPQVQPVQLLHTNPNYAHVKFLDGSTDTLPLRDLALPGSPLPHTPTQREPASRWRFRSGSRSQSFLHYRPRTCTSSQGCKEATCFETKLQNS
ncbi:uncharacterized protein [Narcine bancroftii]|uniref:uncharacterized protein n=1 Tax=Narcine bancroftii TaxID=1343680 RepID=UPI0038313A40